MKASAIAPSNVALLKYWGRKDEILRLPENGSISMNLSNLFTTTTVEFSRSFSEDTVAINDEEDPQASSRVAKHLDRIRALAGISDRAKVVSENSFPSGTGLSSSASGFAALTVAGAVASGLTLSQRELSILARQGSGSACRSIPDGFVEWFDGETSEESHAVSIFPPQHWDICDIVAVVSKEKKHVSTSQGQQGSRSSPFLADRLRRMPEKIIRMKKFLAERNFPALGLMVEAEALELHSIMLTQDPPLLYWLPGTIEVMRAVQLWRSEGLPVYFTVNTGQDIHLLCERGSVEDVSAQLKKLECVCEVIVNTPGLGARLIEEHLF